VTRVAVVGHVEWVEFAVVDRVPLPGEIVHAGETLALPGGSGASVAVGLRKLAGAAEFLTTVGADALGEEAVAALRAQGLEVHATRREDAPTRRCWTHIDAQAERTITVLGARIAPRGDDALPWDDLAACDAVFFSAGDAGALRAARAARVLVLTRRALDTALEAQVPIDAIVSSATDPGEQGDLSALAATPQLVVETDGARGGRWRRPDGSGGTWAAAPPPGPPADAYGCGDAFAAGLTFALGAGRPIADAADLGARCGAACLAGRGPDAWVVTP
jgi:ribokinase